MLTFNIDVGFYWFGRDPCCERGRTRAFDPKARNGKFVPELVDFFKEVEGKREIRVSGEEMLLRANKIAPGDLSGQEHALSMLIEQDKIPHGWQKSALVFPEAIRQGADDSQRVLCLHFMGDRWILTHKSINDDFESYHRIVHLRR